MKEHTINNNKHIIIVKQVRNLALNMAKEWRTGKLGKRLNYTPAIEDLWGASPAVKFSNEIQSRCIELENFLPCEGNWNVQNIKEFSKRYAIIYHMRISENLSKLFQVCPITRPRNLITPLFKIIIFNKHYLSNFIVRKQCLRDSYSKKR